MPELIELEVEEALSEIAPARKRRERPADIPGTEESESVDSESEDRIFGGLENQVYEDDWLI